MTATRVEPPFSSYFTADGSPIESGRIYIGKVGLNPETNPVAVFWDDALTIPAAQPIRTIGGYPSRNGSPASIYCAGRYSITVKTRDGVVIYSALQSGSVQSETMGWADLDALTYDDVTAGQYITADGYDYIVAASSASDAQFTGAGGVKFYVLTPDVRAFGVGRGNDDTAMINAFWAWVSADDVGVATFAGNMSVSGLVTAGPSVAPMATKRVIFGADLTSTSALDQQWLWRNSANLVGVGFLRMTGVGAVNDYSTFTVKTAMAFNGDCKHMVLPATEFHKFRDYAIDLTDDGVGSDLMSFVTFGPIDADDIGLWIGQGGVTAVTLTSAPVNNGSSGANTQTATLQCSSVPAALAAGDMVKVGNRAHYITSVAGTTVTVFPWVESTVTSGATIAFMRGAAVRVSGNDANLARFSMIRATRCNTALLHDASYNVTADRVYAQYCSTPMIVGGNPSAAVHGFSITALGGEGSVDFPPIILTRALSGGMAQGYPLNGWYAAHRAGVTGDVFVKERAAKGVEQTITDDGVFGIQWNRPRNDLDATIANNVLTNGPKSTAMLANADPDLTIKFTNANDDGYGYNSCRVVWAATSVSAANNLELALDATDAAAGWKIDYAGGAFAGSTLTVPSGAHPFGAAIIADVDAKKWVVQPDTGVLTLTKAATWNIGSTASGATATLAVTVTGCLTTDAVFVSASASMAAIGFAIDGYVSANGTVTLTARNNTGGTVDPASMTAYIVVKRIVN